MVDKERKLGKCIQGLFVPDTEDRGYGTLLAYVVLSKFRIKKRTVSNDSEKA